VIRLTVSLVDRCFSLFLAPKSCIVFFIFKVSL